uniref:Uncharacterized protein n=1 Tax=Pyxicephalus adspersus TaxID=30357 RepID=A0AAV3AUB0_PYXAD|nr:TPA: hypothetical protein GDO54_007319 [Pyxicephalus adspersus]
MSGKILEHYYSYMQRGKDKNKTYSFYNDKQSKTLLTDNMKHVYCILCFTLADSRAELNCVPALSIVHQSDAHVVLMILTSSNRG